MQQIILMSGKYSIVSLDPDNPRLQLSALAAAQHVGAVQELCCASLLCWQGMHIGTFTWSCPDTYQPRSHHTTAAVYQTAL